MNNLNRTIGNSLLFQENAGISGQSIASARQKMDQLTTQATDQALWATAQGLALAKLKVFSHMAKSVNDQAGQ